MSTFSDMVGNQCFEGLSSLFVGIRAYYKFEYAPGEHNRNRYICVARSTQSAYRMEEGRKLKDKAANGMQSSHQAGKLYVEFCNTYGRDRIVNNDMPQYFMRINGDHISSVFDPLLSHVYAYGDFTYSKDYKKRGRAAKHAFLFCFEGCHRGDKALEGGTIECFAIPNSAADAGVIYKHALEGRLEEELQKFRAEAVEDYPEPI